MEKEKTFHVIPLTKRVQRIEGICGVLLDEQPDVQQAALEAAATSGDAEAAAAAARAIRNRLLADSDSQMLIDRMGLEEPTGTTFKDWLPYLQAIASAQSGKWGAYRQALRDLTKQEGFPLEIEWPVNPDEQA